MRILILVVGWWISGLCAGLEAQGPDSQDLLFQVTVAQRNGFPVSGARVLVWATWSEQARWVFEGRTDAEGRLGIPLRSAEGLTDWDRRHAGYEVFALAQGLGATAESFSFDDPGYSQPLALVLDSRAWWEGRILDDSGRPWSGLSVRHPGGWMPRTDQGGRIVLFWDPEHTTELELVHPSLGRLPWTIPDIRVDSGLEGQVLVVRPHGADLRGRLLGSANEALAGLALELSRISEFEPEEEALTEVHESCDLDLNGSAIVTTDAEGRFHATNLIEGRYEVRTLSDRILGVMGTAAHEKTWRLGAEFVAVRVEDELGRSYAEVKVGLMRLLREPGQEPILDEAADAGTTTDGWITLEVPAGGAPRVLTWREDCATHLRGTGERLVPETGGTVRIVLPSQSGVNLVFEPEEPFTGRLEWCLRSLRTGEVLGRGGDDGDAAPQRRWFVKLAPGSYQLEVLARWQDARGFGWPSPLQVQTIDLPRRGEIRVPLRLTMGGLLDVSLGSGPNAEVGQARVRAPTLDRVFVYPFGSCGVYYSPWIPFGSTGRGRDGLPPGPLDLEVTTDEGATWTGQVDIVAGQRSHLELPVSAFKLR
ncbi:MAG: hypothetical protein KDB53_18200 [Planctomycetes bacterium]|nr:hypothetical protein [Planctomycetota bacterium]